MEPTMIGLIVIVVIIVLTAVAVGIYFGVKNSKGGSKSSGSDSSAKESAAEDSSSSSESSSGSKAASSALATGSAASSSGTAAAMPAPATSSASAGGVGGYKEYPGLSWIKPNGNWSSDAYDALSDYIPVSAKYPGLSKEECVGKCSDTRDACMGVAYDPANQRCALLRVGISDGKGTPYPGAGDGWVLGVRKDDNTYKEFKNVGLNKPLASLNPSYFKKLPNITSPDTCKLMCNTSIGACHGVMYKNVIDDVNMGERQFSCYHFNIPSASGVNSTVSTLMKTA